MYNWIKKGIVTAGVILTTATAGLSQNMSSIIEEIQKDKNTVETYTIDKAISKSLNSNITIRKRLREIKKDTLYFEIERNNRKKIDLNGSASLGYNIKDGIKDFENTKAYPEFNTTFTIPILNTDTKYELQIRVNEIKKEKIRLLYDISNVIHATGNNYINILNNKKQREINDEEKQFIKKILSKQKDLIKLEANKNDFESRLIKIDNSQLELKQKYAGQINNLSSRFGKISRGKLEFADSLKLPEKDLFEKPTYSPKNIDGYLDTLAASSVIIRTQIERINIENSVISYMMKTNFEITGSTSLNLRNTVVPTPYFGTPINTGIRFNIFGNNVKQEKEIARLNIQNQQDNIKKVINTIVPGVQESYNKMLLAINLATKENKETYKKQLEETTKIYLDNTEMTNNEEIKLSKFSETIKNHYDAKRAYYTNISKAMKEEYRVKSYFLFQKNMFEFTKTLEEGIKNYELRSREDIKKSRQNLRDKRIPELKSIK